MLPLIFAPFQPFNNRCINYGYLATNLSTTKLCLTKPKDLIGIFLILYLLVCLGLRVKPTMACFASSVRPS